MKSPLCECCYWFWWEDPDELYTGIHKVAKTEWQTKTDLVHIYYANGVGSPSVDDTSPLLPSRSSAA